MKKVRLVTVLVMSFCQLGVFTTATHAQESRRIRIINHASSPIRYVYASNVDSTSWEEDILGPMRVIPTDYYVDANLDDGTGHCLYDIKAVLYDGREAVRHNLNVCTTSSWTVNDQE